MKLLLCQPWHATAGRAFQPIITAGIMVLLAGILLLCWPTPGKEATPVAAATMPPASTPSTPQPIATQPATSDA